MVSPFVRWWLFALAFAAALFWGVYSKAVQSIMAVDVTHLTSVNLVLFVIVSLILGRNTYILNLDNTEDVRKALNLGHFMSSFCMSIGLLGTVIGLIIMVQTQVAGVNTSDPASMLTLVGTVMSALGTALYTTAVGIGTAMLIQIQCFNLEAALKDHEF